MLQRHVESYQTVEKISFDLKISVSCLLSLIFAMPFSNTVATAFLRFVLFQVEGTCFSKSSLKGLCSNTWHSFSSNEMLIEFNTFRHDRQRLSFCCTHARIENESENVAETIHKMTLDLDVIQLVKQFFQTNICIE